MLSPACMWSKARFTSSSPSVCVIISSTLMRPLMYQSTYCGNWVRPRVPPKAVPRQARPVTSRNGRAWISSPAPATPMMIACPQPLRVGADLRERDLGDDGPFGEGRGPHVMMQHAPAVREPARAVRHEALPLGGEQRAAQVRPAREAELALAALGDVERDHVVAGSEARDPGPDLLDHAAALVAEDRREEARGVAPAHRVGVGVAGAGRDQADQALAGARAFEG